MIRRMIFSRTAGRGVSGTHASPISATRWCADATPRVQSSQERRCVSNAVFSSPSSTPSAYSSDSSDVTCSAISIDERLHDFQKLRFDLVPRKACAPFHIGLRETFVKRHFHRLPVLLRQRQDTLAQRIRQSQQLPFG